MSLSRKAIEIAGLRIDQLSVSASIEQIGQHLRANQPGSLCVIKPYVKFFTVASKNRRLLAQLNQADLALADGISVQWAASYLYGQPKIKPNIINLFRSLLFWIHRPDWIGQVIPDRGAGVDATVRLLKAAEKNGWRAGIMTGHAEQSDKIKNNLGRRFDKLKFLRVWPGFFDSGSKEETEIINEIKKAKLDILFVGRGFPLQEEFILRQRQSGLARVLIAEGGSFDYDQLGGSVKRAPRRWQRLGLEWLWRSFNQPKKFSSLFDVLSFINLVYKQAKKQK